MLFQNIFQSEEFAQRAEGSEQEKKVPRTTSEWSEKRKKENGKRHATHTIKIVKGGKKKRQRGDSSRSLTVAGETLVACVKFGVDSDESMLLFDL